MWLESEWRPLTIFKVMREICCQVSPRYTKCLPHPHWPYGSADQALVSRAADELPAVFQEGVPGVIGHPMDGNIARTLLVLC